MSRSKTSADRVNAASRRVKVVQMRMAGLAVREIATQVGCSPGTVSKDLYHALSEYQTNTEEEIERFRELWNQRLEKMVQGLWVSASRGNVGAVDRIVRLAERSARLNGLDRPVKVAPTNPNGDQPYEPEGMTDEQITAGIAAVLDAARARSSGNAPPGQNPDPGS